MNEVKSRSRHNFSLHGYILTMPGKAKWVLQDSPINGGWYCTAGFNRFQWPSAGTFWPSVPQYAFRSGYLPWPRTMSLKALFHGPLQLLILVNNTLA